MQNRYSLKALIPGDKIRFSHWRMNTDTDLGNYLCMEKNTTTDPATGTRLLHYKLKNLNTKKVVDFYPDHQTKIHTLAGNLYSDSHLAYYIERPYIYLPITPKQRSIMHHNNTQTSKSSGIGDSSSQDLKSKCTIL